MAIAAGALVVNRIGAPERDFCIAKFILTQTGLKRIVGGKCQVATDPRAAHGGLPIFLPLLRRWGSVRIVDDFLGHAFIIKAKG